MIRTNWYPRILPVVSAAAATLWPDPSMADDEETEGLDYTSHGESGYSL